MSTSASVIEAIDQQDYNKALKICNTNIHKGNDANYFKTMKGF